MTLKEMRSEQDCKVQERYLFTEAIFSAEAMAIWQGECNSRFQNKEKNAAYYRFINWVKAHNEIALFTMYAYADFTIPKKFDSVFDLDNPSDFTITPFSLTQSIYEGWYPVEYVEHGHKHLCIFEFEKQIPQLIQRMHVTKGKFYDVPPQSLRIGLCHSTDFAIIRNRIEYQLSLKQEYGQDWWKFDKDE
ncbi:hypothetical protein Q0590_08745 [Rhodocytophaga aerolata]|uniref:Uncharacterized protein n=1 Tax=Rhodocytophaga aerolata TaxID=455078 RepID=A0ABT8R3T5_9BACT|nr:hypothetical protein [Rhodocytophaga aerolata]MDO1446336.1 hypothetical protein [Rhodocytophaga aerolata]